MKTHKSVLLVILMLGIITFQFSCEQDKVDPAIILDEVFIPEGYAQIDSPPDDALARLVELRLANPSDHYYYLQRNDLATDKWIFPQTELKIEEVEHNDELATSKSVVTGVIVKKIKGDWKDENFTIVENQPVPKEGMKAFYQYIQENIKYPEEAKKMGIEGKVFVQFVVDTEGRLTEVKAVKGIGAGCDEEAVRVLLEAPLWNPATVVDMPVKTRMILPINFKLD